MKRTAFLSALGALAVGLGSASTARAIDDATFFQGVYLGTTMKEIDAFYRPYRYELGEMWHSGALPGEKDFDIRAASVPQRRIYFSVRASDNRPSCTGSDSLHKKFTGQPSALTVDRQATRNVVFLKTLSGGAT